MSVDLVAGFVIWLHYTKSNSLIRISFPGSDCPRDMPGVRQVINSQTLVTILHSSLFTIYLSLLVEVLVSLSVFRQSVHVGSDSQRSIIRLQTQRVNGRAAPRYLSRREM